MDRDSQSDSSRTGPPPSRESMSRQIPVVPPTLPNEEHSSEPCGENSHY